MVLRFHASWNFLLKVSRRQKHQKATLSIVVAMNRLSIGDNITTDLATEDQVVEIRDRISGDNQVAEVQGRARWS